MIKAVMLVERGVQDEEFIFPFYRMQEEGWFVGVATPSGKSVFGKYGFPVMATHELEKLGEYEFDVVVIPGGFESPDRLRMRLDVRAFVGYCFGYGKLIAAICHGPWVCISAGIVRGRHVTGYASIRDDLVNAGAEYLDQSVVVDGNLITAQHYRNNGAFMKAVIAWTKAKEWGPELCGAAARP